MDQMHSEVVPNPHGSVILLHCDSHAMAGVGPAAEHNGHNGGAARSPRPLGAGLAQQGGDAGRRRGRPRGKMAPPRQAGAEPPGNGSERRGGGGRRIRRREGSGGGEVGGGLSPARSAAGHAAEPEHAAPGAGLRFGGHVISYQSVQLREAWVSGLEETRHRRTYGKGQRGP